MKTNRLARMSVTGGAVEIAECVKASYSYRTYNIEQNRVEERNYKNLKYLISYPEELEDTRQYPLWIHLHGAGGRGNDIALLKAAGPISEIQSGRYLSLIVVSPQCDADT